VRIKDTKTHQIRRIAIDGFGIEVLRRHRAEVEGRAEYAGVELEDSWPIFCHLSSGSYDFTRPINPDTVTHLVTRIARQAGIAATPHTLRHFMATQMIATGNDIRTVAGRLGHAKPSTTLDVYAHVMPQRDRDAALGIGAALEG
jgi:integrase